MARPLAALAALFLAAHLLHLPSSLEDIDSINFALGVRDFDVAQHQPHPPGYPVFIGLAKASTAGLQTLDVPAAPVRGLAVLSALSGALMIPVLFLLFRRLTGDPRLAWWAMAVVVCSPLFWFTALRPLSDMTGLLLAAAAQSLLIGAITARDAGSPRRFPRHRAADVLRAVSATRAPATSRPAADAASPRVEPGIPGTADPVTPRPADPASPPGHEPRFPSAAALLVLGAALAGVAAGARAQTVALTVPLLAAALLWPGLPLRMRDRGAAVLAAAGGALAWAAPLLAASGGLGGYLEALGSQAGEDFSGVVMLWTTRSGRVALDAALYTFVWPWGSPWLGALVVAGSALGLARLVWRRPLAAALVLVAFAPYAVFHLLFQETATMRYALPLVLPAGLLATYALAGAGRHVLTIGGAAAAAVMLLAAVPAGHAYARDGSPAFRAFQAAAIDATVPTAGPHAPAIGMHAVMRRVAEWMADGDGRRILVARHGRESLALVEHWRRGPDVPVRFLADPRRTDLALFDPRARRVVGRARWTFPALPFVAGARPGATDVVDMQPPGWMLASGWALTAEIGGVTARDGLGPHVEPSTAWVRADPAARLLMIGGRNLGAAGSPAARLTLAGPAERIESWNLPPGFFFKTLPVAPGTFAGEGYLPMRASATAADGSARPVQVSLEQFDLQPDGVVMAGFADGWGEPEYNPATALAWRWMSERAVLWVRPVGRDLLLRLAGESPLRYFDSAPTVRLLVGEGEVARFQPQSDFIQEVTLPAGALERAGGRVIVESDRWFSPAERTGGADRRHLALRIYAVDVR